MKRSIIGIALTTAALSVGATSYAASVSVTGATASNSGNNLSIHDTKCDGYEAYANWNSSSGNRVQATGGCYVLKSITVSPLNNFRACVDKPSGPDTCSSWVTP